MKGIAKLILVLITLCSLSLFGQDPEAQIDAQIFPPELVMQNQRAIGLTEAQANEIKGHVQQAQAIFTDIQWTIQRDMEIFVEMLSKESIDEGPALEQLGKILMQEAQVKRTRLTLALRIKNVLTADQQQKLRAIRGQ